MVATPPSRAATGCSKQAEQSLCAGLETSSPINKELQKLLEQSSSLRSHVLTPTLWPRQSQQKQTAQKMLLSLALVLKVSLCCLSIYTLWPSSSKKQATGPAVACQSSGDIWQSFRKDKILSTAISCSSLLETVWPQGSDCSPTFLLL